MAAEASYPDTRRTWFLVRLESGAAGAAEARALVMELYAEPLRQTARRWFRLSAEDALDLVHGFLASRLQRHDYFAQWAASGKRLREWLWLGLDYFLREQRRSERRRAAAGTLPDLPDPASGDPGRDLDRSFAEVIVRAAMKRAEQACQAEGFAAHWAVFARRAAGEPLAAIGRTLGISASQAQVRMRAPQRRFVSALTELLVADGVGREDVPRAIADLLALEHP
jgi:hypothetical protein